MYILCFIDRSNIVSYHSNYSPLTYRCRKGNAKILNNDKGHSLQQSLHLTDNQYIIALMVFYVAYTVFEVPSNYLLKKYKPSRWFSFLMMAWGALTMLIAATRNYGGLLATRFLLGMFEAGLFPGVNYYLSWFVYPLVHW